MPDLFYILSKWWKQMLLVLVLSLTIVGTIVFLQPSQYLAIATALPANPASADKASVFGNYVQGLYSPLGSPDDLYKVIGTAQLDTVYLSVTDEFNLADHYKPAVKAELLRYTSAKLLKASSDVIKSEFGELKVKVWDKDKILAAELANAVMVKLEAIHRNLQNESNKNTLYSLQQGRKKLLLQTDSMNVLLSSNGSPYNTAALTTQKNILQEQVNNYDKLIGEYQLMLDSRPAVLMIVEKARAASSPDKPKRLQILIATAFLSLFFALLVALVLERRKKI